MLVGTAIAVYPKPPATVSPHSSMKRSLSAKCILIQKFVGASLGHRLNLANAIAHRAGDGEAVGEVVDQAEFLDHCVPQ